MRLKPAIKYLSITALFTVILAAAAISEQKEPTAADRLSAYINALSSNDMGGRLPGTDGNLKAADFIEKQFRNFGVEPINGSYRQEFPYVNGSVAETSSQVSFDCLIERVGVPRDMWKKMPRPWQINKEWIPLDFSASGSGSSQVVFAGFGITAPDLKYDDYQGIDAKGKFVMVLTNAPYDQKKYKSKYDKKTYEDFKDYAFLPHKLKNARDHGAMGIILVKVQSDSADILEPIATTPELLNSGLVCIMATRTDAGKLFPGTRQLYPMEEELNKTRIPKSFLLDNATINYNIKLIENVIKIPNIAGVVKGTDPALANEYIIVSSHFDHIGTGTEAGRFTYSSRVFFTYKGADDNASGVAAMLELSERIAKNPLKRPVLFISFNAEEGKLFGSDYYVKNPLLPLEKTRVVINLDMIGRMKGRLNVNSINSIEGFEELLVLKAGTDSLGVVQSPDTPEPSSHEAFRTANIPAAAFFTDFHEDIHTKNDVPEKIKYSELSRIVNYIEAILGKLGN